MRRALIIGGTGMIGRAVARRLVRRGWTVDLVARTAEWLPVDLRTAPVTLHLADRRDPAALAAAAGPGADLVVDCVCFTAAHARTLVPLLADATSAVLVSSKAVYVDAAGNHSNSAEPPDFGEPVTEAQPTLAPDLSDEYDSRAGYGACKVAAERILLDTGAPVTVLRPSKVHGEGARKPNEWAFVKRILDQRTVLPLTHEGRCADHPSAAVNIAALVEWVADHPGARVLNAADPDTPTEHDIAGIVGRHFGHDWDEAPVAEHAAVGRHPWSRWPPVRLDTSAATALGYRPAGDYGATVAPTLDWLASIAEPGPGGVQLPDGYDNAYFERLIDYAREDDALAQHQPG